ncbi:Putative HsdS-like restriction-modification system protein (fragment) [Mycobacterium canettii CIPT 140070010]
MPLPLPPIAEQDEIVRSSNALFGKAIRLTTAINAASTRIDRSSQANLAKAVRGELSRSCAAWRAQLDVKDLC